MRRVVIKDWIPIGILLESVIQIFLLLLLLRIILFRILLLLLEELMKIEALLAFCGRSIPQSHVFHFLFLLRPRLQLPGWSVKDDANLIATESRKLVSFLEDGLHSVGQTGRCE